jgi:hypothetical protein
MQRPYRLCIRPIQHVPAVPSHVHKLHLQKHPQVLRHRRLLKSQPHHNFPDRPFPRRQKLQYFPPPRFGHRIKRIRCGCRPRHARTLHAHIGICQARFLSHNDSFSGFWASALYSPNAPIASSFLTPSTLNWRVIPSGANQFFQTFFVSPGLRSLLPQRPSSMSFRVKQTGFFFLLRSCEVAGLRSRGISLRLFP